MGLLVFLLAESLGKLKTCRHKHEAVILVEPPAPVGYLDLVSFHPFQRLFEKRGLSMTMASLLLWAEDPPVWQQIDLYRYLAYGGGGLVLLALILYFIPGGRLKIPGVIGGVLGGLAAGAGAGVLAMASMGYHWEEHGPEKGSDAVPATGPVGMGAGWQTYSPPNRA